MFLYREEGVSLFSMSGSLAIRESGSLEQPGSLPPVTCSQEGLNLLQLLHLLNLLNLLRGPNCGPPNLAAWQSGSLAACQFGNLAIWQSSSLFSYIGRMLTPSL